MKSGKNILVAGLVNLETTVRVPGFPLEYSPIHYHFFGIDTKVSGVGMNIASALTKLGDDVRLVSLVGRDGGGRMAMEELRKSGIRPDFIRPGIKSTPQSVILYDGAGRRQIHCDLKDVQDSGVDRDLFQRAMEGCGVAALCNINFSRPLLKAAREAGKTVATDVHVISSLSDEYNADFMKYSDILFMSDEALPEPAESFAEKVSQTYGNSIIVIGLGAKGSLLYVREDRFARRFPAAAAPKVVSTAGAGDALFSAFLHCYAQTGDPYVSIQKANLFASRKIGSAGSSEGFLSETELDALYNLSDRGKAWDKSHES